MHDKALSIIIVNWNTRVLVRKCLESVFATISDIDAEVIVVDNASSDGSPEVIEASFTQAQLIRNAENRGFAAANNQGMRIARGRHVLLLNSDTIVLEGAITGALQYMNEHAHVAVLGCQVLNTDGSIQNTCFRDPDLRTLAVVTSGLHRLPWPRFLGRHVMRGWSRDSERDVDVVTGCFMLVRRSAIDHVGLFDEQFFFYAEEADWCRRFRKAGWAVRFAPVGRIIHHGAASALQLDERRTVLLGEALVRLLHKRRGWLVATIAWAMLLAFNASRSIIWLLTAAFTRRRSAMRRSRQYALATRQFLDAWPRTPSTRRNRIRNGTKVEVAGVGRRYSNSRARCPSGPQSMADVEREMTDQNRRRVLAIASGGGHWVQLLRLRPALTGHDVTYVTVSRAYQDDLGDERLFVVPDATRWTRLRLIALMIRMFVIVARVRPDVVLSTGAAPGYFGIHFGKLFGARTLWIDSIANVEHVSLSGQKVASFADIRLTQWASLADESSNLAYAGAVV